MGALSISDAREALSRVFRYPAFRPGQSAAVASLLRGRDTVVILPTGGGKSLCYQVPAVMLPGLTVVVSPLISLMRDQVRALGAKGVAAAFLNSTLSASESSDVTARAEGGDLKMLYVAPERFEAGELAERLRPRVSALAVDEAHCISHWGHDFRPSYRRLSEVRRRLGWPPTIALTATATPEVRSDITQQLKLRNPTVVVTGFDRANLEYSAEPAKNDAIKAPKILNAIRASTGSSIVYASTKNSVDRIAASLRAAGVSVGAYHAGLDAERRKRIQDSFMSGGVRTIVATNAFGMGIDKPDVRLVVHHSMPGTLEAYYQEAGRAGRDGKRSHVLLLHTYADRFTHEFFIANANPPRPVVEAVYAAVQSGAKRGFFSGSAADIHLPTHGRTTPRQTESALRILSAAGALTVEQPDSSFISVRFVATPDRIRRELGEENALEIGLLRALWRPSRNRPHGATKIDLDGLPPGLNGAASCAPLLERLQALQLIHWERVGGGIRLARPSATLDEFAVDWPAIERRRKSEVAKLDTMQRYACTRFCRRAFFLRYFGEADPSRRCASCDNCR